LPLSPTRGLEITGKIQGMTPKEAAAALVGAMPTGISASQLEEYGIGVTEDRPQAISREVISLNLFWIFAAIEAHLPQKYQAVVSELVLNAVEAGWSSTYPVGSIAWTAYLAEWKERTQRYERLVQDGASPLAICAEAGMLLEEEHVIGEEDLRNVLTLLIDSVPVDTYGHLLEDIG
jgi:hypothetical protein